MAGLSDQWRRWARALRHEVRALIFAYHDPRTPWYARFAALCVAGYALSPIDLIPDPIPILGYLDDFILLPVGIWFAIRLIPPGVLEESRQRARSGEALALGSHKLAAAVIVSLWVLAIGLCIWLGAKWF